MTDAPARHRYAMEELLDEMPPGWKRPFGPGSACLKHREKQAIQVYRNADDTWDAIVVSPGRAPGPELVEYLRKTRWPTPHAAMSAIDNWLDENTH